MYSGLKDLFGSKPGNLSELIKQALPAAISQASFSLMMFTDRLLLTPLGKETPSASMLGGFTSFLMIIFFVGLVGYITPLTAQFVGAQQTKNISPLMHQGTLIALFVSPFIIYLGPSLAEIYFGWIEIKPVQSALAMKYFNIINWGCFFSIMNVVLSGCFIGIGKTYIVMTVNFLGMLVNIPLTYFLIKYGFFGYYAGIEGAGLGSLLSAIVMTVLFGILYLGPQMKKEFQTNLKIRFQLDLFKKLLKFGTPSGFEAALTFGAFSTFLALFHSYGPYEALSATIALNWEIAAFLPAWGVGIGVSSLVGKYMGARNLDGAIRTVFSGFIATYFVMILACFLFMSQTEALVGLFIPKGSDEEFAKIYNLSGPMLQLVCLYCLCNAFNLILSGALRAAGDTKAVMLIAISGQWILLFVGYYSIKIAQFQPLVSWFLFCCSLGFESIFFAFRFKQGRWKEIKVV